MYAWLEEPLPAKPLLRVEPLTLLVGLNFPTSYFRTEGISYPPKRCLTRNSV